MYKSCTCYHINASDYKSTSSILYRKTITFSLNFCFMATLLHGSIFRVSLVFCSLFSLLRHFLFVILATLLIWFEISVSYCQEDEQQNIQRNKAGKQEELHRLNVFQRKTNRLIFKIGTIVNWKFHKYKYLSLNQSGFGDNSDN